MRAHQARLLGAEEPGGGWEQSFQGAKVEHWVREFPLVWIKLGFTGLRAAQPSSDTQVNLSSLYPGPPLATQASLLCVHQSMLTPTQSPVAL